MEPEKASFKFVNFRVPSFSCRESKGTKSELHLNFLPSGEYFSNEGKFLLTINFTGHEKVAEKDEKLIDVTGIAEFKFSGNIGMDEIPEYFYSNSIAIVFPYLRAFISTLTLQANTGLIMLGLFNFTNMAQALKKNTIEG